MVTKLGKLLNKRVKSAFRLVSVNAVNTVLVQSDTSLTQLKIVAREKADSMKVLSAEKKDTVNQLQVQINILDTNSGEIVSALDELSSAEGKL